MSDEMNFVKLARAKKPIGFKDEVENALYAQAGVAIQSVKEKVAGNFFNPAQETEENEDES